MKLAIGIYFIISILFYGVIHHDLLELRQDNQKSLVLKIKEGSKITFVEP